MFLLENDESDVGELKHSVFARDAVGYVKQQMVHLCFQRFFESYFARPEILSTFYILF